MSSSDFVPRWLAALGLGMLAASAGAQVYRSVGPDGRVTYTDARPAAASSAPNAAAAAAASTPDVRGASSALPYGLGQLAQRYPVVLHAGANCAPCDMGRSLLVARGIPFTEKTVQSNDDLTALQRLAGSTDLPLLTIGAQQLKGFSSADWGAYLDAAGYPKTSQLPGSYRVPPASPLVAVRPAPAAASGPSSAASAAAATPVDAARRLAPPATPVTAPSSTSTNPAGIRF